MLAAISDGGEDALTRHVTLGGAAHVGTMVCGLRSGGCKVRWYLLGWSAAMSRISASSPAEAASRRSESGASHSWSRAGDPSTRAVQRR